MAKETILTTLQKSLAEQIAQASNIQSLEQIRIQALGKKGEISLLLQKIKSVPAEERKTYGQEVNALKGTITEKISERMQVLQNLALEQKLQAEMIDTSLPERPFSIGALHPIRQVTNEIIEILGSMGFVCAEGPEIEDDFHNFTALNIPKDHPARQMQDTFYIDDESGGEPKVLRTHTSPVQVRIMQTQTPPIRVISAGRTYRCDSDMTHTPMFHQIEGLVIDETTHFGHLKGCLYDFCRAYFELEDVALQFRPSYFPFTEPSAEVDIGCMRKDGELRLGSGGDWMEILGCGMVHPNVLTNCGIDPKKYQGFAFGMGIERLAMLKYGMADLRQFFDGDYRWLRHYGFMGMEL